jgi:hypothetical protein
LERMQKIFPLVYLKASLLPDLDDDQFETPEKFVGEVDYSFLLSKISEKLGQFDSYQEVFVEGMQFSEAAIDVSIAENICDIYQDLKDFIMAYRIGTTDIMADALWECSNNFKTYWGQKLVNGLRAIHTLMYGEVDLNEEMPQQINTDDKSKTKGKSKWVDRQFSSFEEED